MQRAFFITLGATDITSVLVLVGGLVAVVIVATVVLLLVRRKILAASRQSGSPASVMETMRQLHEEGKLSDAEFQAVRTRMASAVRAEPSVKASGNLKRTKPLGIDEPPGPSAPKRTLPPPAKGQ